MTTGREFPLVSVVICTFNGGKYIGACLESLAGQNYPPGRFEIIVVDDGSTDNTSEIARAKGAHVIRRETNHGIAASRGSGLAAAKGEIIAYIDDDCIADVHWLFNLVEPLRGSEFTASGGRILPYKTDRFAERYLSAAGYGNPVALAFGESKNPLWRFWIYAKTMFRPIDVATKPIEVEAVFTASVAYRTAALRSIGGFDETLITGEDADVAKRLRQDGKRLVFVPQAIVWHRHPQNIGTFIFKIYRRAQGYSQFYSKEKKSLPLFPLPLLYIALALFLIILKPTFGIVFLVVGPIILYPWWFARALRERHLEYISYGYVQLAIEIATLLGLARAGIKIR